MKVASTFGIMVPDENSPTEAGLVTSIIRVAPEAEGQALSNLSLLVSIVTPV